MMISNESIWAPKCLVILLSPTPDSANARSSEDVGLRVFQDLQAANQSSYWNPSLQESIRRLTYAGFVKPGSLFVSGSEASLQVLKDAWSRRMLNAPKGFTIKTMGEISGIALHEVPQTQFVSLLEAICLVIKTLNQAGQLASIERIAAALQTYFPDISVPSRQILQSSIGSLMLTRRIKCMDDGYFTVMTPALLHHYEEQEMQRAQLQQHAKLLQNLRRPVGRCPEADRGVYYQEMCSRECQTGSSVIDGTLPYGFDAISCDLRLSARAACDKSGSGPTNAATSKTKVCQRLRSARTTDARLAELQPPKPPSTGQLVGDKAKFWTALLCGTKTERERQSKRNSCKAIVTTGLPGANQVGEVSSNGKAIRVPAAELQPLVSDFGTAAATRPMQATFSAQFPPSDWLPAALCTDSPLYPANMQCLPQACLKPDNALRKNVLDEPHAGAGTSRQRRCNRDVESSHRRQRHYAAAAIPESKLTGHRHRREPATLRETAVCTAQELSNSSECFFQLRSSRGRAKCQPHKIVTRSHHPKVFGRSSQRHSYNYRRPTAFTTEDLYEIEEPFRRHYDISAREHDSDSTLARVDHRRSKFYHADRPTQKKREWQEMMATSHSCRTIEKHLSTVGNTMFSMQQHADCKRLLQTSLDSSMGNNSGIAGRNATPVDCSAESKQHRNRAMISHEVNQQGSAEVSRSSARPEESTNVHEIPTDCVASNCDNGHALEKMTRCLDKMLIDEPFSGQLASHESPDSLKADSAFSRSPIVTEMSSNSSCGSSNRSSKKYSSLSDGDGVTGEELRETFCPESASANHTYENIVCQQRIVNRSKPHSVSLDETKYENLTIADDCNNNNEIAAMTTSSSAVANSKGDGSLPVDSGKPSNANIAGVDELNNLADGRRFSEYYISAL